VPFVGVEDHLGLVVVGLPRAEHLVGGVDLTGVQHPFPVESECRGALRGAAERVDVTDLQVRAVDCLQAVGTSRHEDGHEDVVVGVAAVVAVGLLAHDEGAHVDARHEVGRPEHEGLHSWARGGDLVDVRQPPSVLDLGFDTDPPHLEAVGLLHLGQQQVECFDMARGGNLRQQDRVELRAGTPDDGRDVEVGGVGGPVVDAHHLELLAPPVLVQRLDDGGAGLFLGQRRHGVLEVEEDRIGGQPLGFVDHLAAAARDCQNGSAWSERERHGRA